MQEHESDPLTPASEYDFAAATELPMTNDRDRRRAQREVFLAAFPGYNPPRHDAFVSRFNSLVANAKLTAWMRKRDIIDES